jgi:hypothetical protein
MLACDFLVVETAFLQRIYVLFFISLATRRIEYVACTANPDGRWVAQQARNFAIQFGAEQPFRFLIHDRDAKFCRAFDVFRSKDITVIRTPVQAPKRTLTPNAGYARCGPTALTGSLSSAVATSSTSIASTATTTTSTGHTGRSLFARPTAGTGRG